MALSRPPYISICQSPDDFQAKRFIQMPIEEVESLLAKHRGIPTFSWMEFDEADKNAIEAEFGALLLSHLDVGLYYVGDDVGYTTIALRPLTPGQVLFFSGDQQSSPPTEHHAYLSAYELFDGSCHYINAQYRGGFASMNIDLPSKREAEQFNTKTDDKQSLTYANLVAESMSLNNQREVICLALDRPVPAMGLIGCSYANSTRLMLKKFIGFDADGNRLNPNMNTVLNRIIYRPLKYRHIEPLQISLYKIIKLIHQEETLSAMLYLNDCNNVDKAKLLHELIPAELTMLETYLRDNASNPIIDAEILRLIKKELSATTYHSYDYRRLMLTMREFNLQQITHRGNGMYYLHHGDFNQTHVLYPDMHKDAEKIGGLIKKTGGSLQVVRDYYQSSLFYAEKLKVSDAFFTKKVTHALQTLEESTEAAPNNIRSQPQ